MKVFSKLLLAGAGLVVVIGTLSGLAGGTEPVEECWSLTRLEDPGTSYVSPEGAIAALGAQMAEAITARVDDNDRSLFLEIASVARDGDLAISQATGDHATVTLRDDGGRTRGTLAVDRTSRGWHVEDIRIRLPMDRCSDD